MRNEFLKFFFVFSLTCVYFKSTFTWFNLNCFPPCCRREGVFFWINLLISITIPTSWQQDYGRVYHFMKEFPAQSHVSEDESFSDIFFHFESWFCDYSCDFFFLQIFGDYSEVSFSKMRISVFRRVLPQAHDCKRIKIFNFTHFLSFYHQVFERYFYFNFYMADFRSWFL